MFDLINFIHILVSLIRSEVSLELRGVDIPEETSGENIRNYLI